MGQETTRFDEVAKKWHALAKRRREHFVELYRSGRWRRYYTEEAFLARMREVVQGAEEWGALANPDANKKDDNKSEAAE